MGRFHVTLFALVAISCLVIGSVNAFTHIVGGSNGWRVVLDNKSFFDDWAKSRTFGVGDRLVFPYRPGGGNIVVVNKKDYEACTQNEVITMHFMGPTIVNLTKPGDYYYYSGIGKHCEAGQKLHISVGNEPGKSGSDPMPFKLDELELLSLAPEPSPSSQSNSTESKSSATTAYDLHFHKFAFLSGFFAFFLSVFV